MIATIHNGRNICMQWHASTQRKKWWISPVAQAK